MVRGPQNCSIILHYRQGMDIKTTEKILIGGLRFSSEQTQLTLSAFSPDFSDVTDLLEDLAKDKVNLPFLCFDTILGTRASVCMARDDFIQRRRSVSEFLQRYIIDSAEPLSTGSLTLFPHQSRLKVFGALLEIFGKNRLALYSVCSSLSALVVNTDFHQLNRAAEVMEEVFLLPENHAPFRQPAKGDSVNGEGESGHTSALETVAVYWEPVIKMYGASVKTDLVMATAHLAQSQLAQLGTELQVAHGGERRFEMAFMQRIDDTTYKLGMLYENTLAESYHTLFNRCKTIFSGLEQRPAELLYMHGPHFQDRYGVASAALKNLQKKQDELFAVGCAGTSIYLITPRKKAHLSATALEKIFIVPTFS